MRVIEILVPTEVAGLFGQIPEWLAEEFPGRVVSWRLERADGGQVVEAVAMLQMYDDLSFSLSERESGPEGWRLKHVEAESLLERGGLGRLGIRLQTRQTQFRSMTELAVSFGMLRGRDGAFVNQVSVSEVIRGSELASVLARIWASNLVPGIKQQAGKYAWETE